MNKRTRNTNETNISLSIEFNNSKKSIINLPKEAGFYKHMLTSMAFYGNLFLEINAKGDIEVDNHHLIEDLGLVLGQSIKQAIRPGIARCYCNNQQMDDAFIISAIDLSNRPFLIWDVKWNTLESFTKLNPPIIKEFFLAFCRGASCNLTIKKEFGENNHHICEAIFKSFGTLIKKSLEITRDKKISSTKGVLYE